MDQLMKISIITPSFNQGLFLEKTILSVLNQEYPQLEYIIIDGGSTDNSTEVIKKYESRLAYWVSEKDRGQSDAINKGLRMATGDVIAYLNSDDVYLPGSLHRVAEAFHRNPDALWVTGAASYVDQSGKEIDQLIPEPVASRREALIRWEGVRRPICIEVSNFFRKEVFDKYGFYNERLHYCMDYEFNTNLFLHDISPVILPEKLAHALLHDQSKTVSQKSKFVFEEFEVVKHLAAKLSAEDRRWVLKKWKSKMFWTEIDQEGVSPVRCLKSVMKYPTWSNLRGALGVLRKSATSWG